MRIPKWLLIAVSALLALGFDSVRTDVFDIAAASTPAEKAAAPSDLVDRFLQTLASGDTDSANALLDANVLIFESGAAERSRQEYAAHHLGADAAFLKSTQYRVLSRTSGAAGDLAWVATEAHLTSSGSKPIDLITTETMILRKTVSGWRIVHVHWSSRTP